MGIGQHLESIENAVLVFLIATISPGPANLAIMTTAMRFGRRAGLSIATGVLTGSLFWGLLAAFSLSILIASYPRVAACIMIFGGLYLAFLAYRAFKSFLEMINKSTVSRNISLSSYQSLYMQGLAIHITNPKSVLAWAAIIAIVVQPTSPTFLPFGIVFGCWFLGILIFYGYAVLFSNVVMITWYKKYGYWIEFGSAFVFISFSIEIICRSVTFIESIVS